LDDSTITEEFARNVGELDPEDIKIGTPILPGLSFGVCEECQAWRPKEDLWWLSRVPEEEGPITGWDLYGDNYRDLCVKCSMKRGLVGLIHSAFNDFVDTYVGLEPPDTPEEALRQLEDQEFLGACFVASLGAATKERLEEAFFKDSFYRRDRVADGVCYAEIKAYLAGEEAS
jgi:hypothetical protein